PAALARWIVFLDELRGDLRDQRLEADVPSEFLRIDRAMPRDYPADVAGPVGAQAIGGRWFCRRWLQRLLDGGHGIDQRYALAITKAAEQRSDVVAGALVQFGEGRLAPGGQCDFADAAVVLRRLA